MQTLQIDEATAARRRIPVYLVDATDGFTPEVGVATPTIEVSKNGAAQGAGAGTWTEIGDGLYYYEATAAEVDTLGFLNARVVKSGVSREFQAVVQVVAWDPYFDFTANLDAAVGGVPAAVEAVLAGAHGSGQWDGTDSDWTAAEREQIRHRLGIDGAATAPSTGVPSVCVDGLLDLASAVEAGITFREFCRAVGAVSAGDIPTPGGPSVSDFAAIGNPGTPRVTSTADANGDRAIVLAL